MKTITVNEIYIEPEYWGEGIYRFKRDQYSVETDDYGIYFDLEVECQEDKEAEISINNIEVFDEDSERVVLSDLEHGRLYREIEKAITIGTLIS
jgi:hypothetical protein